MRLLTVEDEPDLGILLREALSRAGFATDLVTGITAAEDHLAIAPYDAMILDLGLADGDGLTLLYALRRRASMLPVLILTARDRQRTASPVSMPVLMTISSSRSTCRS